MRSSVQGLDVISLDLDVFLFKERCNKVAGSRAACFARAQGSHRATSGNRLQHIACGCGSGAPSTSAQKNLCFFLG